MTTLIEKIAPILANYAQRGEPPFEPATTLVAIGIDRLDLGMIALDIEDRLDLHIRSDAGLEDASTVGAIMACVEAAIAEKAERIAARANSAPRIKRSWFETGAESRA